MKKLLALAGALMLLQGCLAFGDEKVSESSVTGKSSFAWLWGDDAPPVEAERAAPLDTAQDTPADGSAFPYATAIGEIEQRPFARPERNPSTQVFPWIGDVPQTGPDTEAARSRAAILETLQADNINARQEDARLRQGGEAPPPLLRPEHLANIYFGAGSAALAPRDGEIIAQVASRLRAAAESRAFPLNGKPVLRVVGHAAPQEAAGQNGGALAAFSLSLERARRVAAELAARGVAPDSLRVDSQGVETPLVAGATPEMLANPAYRRRVEIYLIQR